MKKNTIMIAASFILILIASQTFFIVRQTEQCLVLQFGQPMRVIKEPGLSLKIPFIEETRYFENRLLEIELSALEVTLKDRRRVVVDAFGRYKIVDPLMFYQTVQSEFGIKRRLNAISLGSLRSILGNLNLPDLLSDARSNVMTQIKNDVNKSAIKFGVILIDVRIRRTDLPKQNSNAVFARMISEREREAKELRAKGEEQSRIITSTADKEAAVMIAEAEKNAQILIGEGEGAANKKYAETFSVDEKFFELYSILNIYKNSIARKENKLILNPDGNIFRFFKSFL